MEEAVVRALLERQLAVAKRDLTSFYLPPVLRAVGAAAVDGVAAEHLGLAALVERLRPRDDHGPRATYFIAGAPGGGKTTLTQQIAVRLLADSCPCVMIDMKRLKGLDATPDGVRDLIIALRPNEVGEERWWKTQTKKGRVVVLIDAWNEIQRRYAGERDLFRVLRALLFGNHRFNVLVTSRDDLDDEVEGLRVPERYVLEPLSVEETEAFLRHWDIDSQHGMRAIRAAGLESTASNPYLLSLVVGLLRDAPGQALPRTRAGLFERTLDEAGRRLSDAEKHLREEGLDLGAALSSCAIASLVGGTLAVSRRDLVSLLRRVWPDRPVDAVIDALADRHLAIRQPGPFGELIALVHESLRDFGLALTFRDRAAPEWAYLPKHAEQVLADWVGLQADPDVAAHAVMPVAARRGRFDLLVDVLMANGSALSDATRQALWWTVGEGLTQGQTVATRACERLALLPRSAAREALQNGVLRPIVRTFPEMEDALRDALLEQRLDAARFRRIQRLHNRGQLTRRSADGSARHRGAVAKEATSVELQELVRDLRTNPNAARRRAAANRLGDEGAGLPDLLQAVQADAAAEVRGAAATALGKLRQSAAAAALVKILESDRDANVRGSAANALGVIGDRSAVAALVKTLESDSDVKVRGSAAHALGAIGDKSAVAALVKALESDSDVKVRGSAAHALGAIGDKSAVAALVKALESDSDAIVRGSAANALGAIGDKSAVAALVKTLESDSDPKNRGSAANALGAIGDKSAVAALVKTLESDGDPKNRGSAANALGAIGDKSAVAALVKTLESDSDAIVRGSAANALGAIGDKSAVAALVKTLQSDSDPKNRGSAANALGAIGDKSAVAALVKTLQSDSDPKNRGSAANALGAIGDKSAVAALVKTLESDRDANVRGSAAHALGAIGDKSAVAALVKTLESDSDVKVRGSAAHALGAIGDKSAVAALVKTLESDSDPKTRGSAAHALGAIGDKSAVAALVKTLESDSDAIVRGSAALIEHGAAVAQLKVTAVSALLAVDPDAPTWLLSFSQRQHGRLENAVRGRIASAIGAAPGCAAHAAWLRTVVWQDAYSPSRTAAVRGLAAQGALDEETVRFVLDPTFSRPGRHKRAPDNAVRGQVVAALMRARAESSMTNKTLFQLAVRQLAESDATSGFIGAGLAPLGALPLPQRQSVLQAFDEELATMPSSNLTLRTRLEKLREQLAFDTQAQADLVALGKAPEAPLRRLRDRVPTVLGKETSMNITENPVALLITAVGAEREAMLHMLRDTASIAPSLEEIGGRYFDRFPHAGRKGPWDVFLGQPTEKGPHAAQALLQDFVKAHRPSLVLMVGMCGGFPERGVKEGSVLLARQVFNYEPARLRDGASVWSPSGYRGTPRLLDLANALASRGEFGEIRVYTTKDYGSGEKLIDDLSSELRQRILDLSGEIIGFEMEGHGLLHAVWELQRTIHFDVAIAKGVSDFGDGKQQHDKESRQRIATRNAAHVAMKLLSVY
ncbi:HEAT repeat domain-containing protein [Sorangium cellulosum]|uniref:HEAT repeat domain-containing protein n=1 Tax=Sorangium cellulosum TaxID=56 RepID=UPI003D9A4E58